MATNQHVEEFVTRLSVKDDSAAGLQQFKQNIQQTADVAARRNADVDFKKFQQAASSSNMGWKDVDFSDFKKTAAGKIASSDSFAKAGEEASDGFLKGMKKKFGEDSTIGLGIKSMMGAGVLGAFTMAANGFKNIAGSIDEMNTKFAMGEMTMSQFKYGLVTSIPIVGSLVDGFAHIGSLISGSAVAQAKLNKELAETEKHAIRRIEEASKRATTEKDVRDTRDALDTEMKQAALAAQGSEYGSALAGIEAARKKKLSEIPKQEETDKMKAAVVEVELKRAAHLKAQEEYRLEVERQKSRYEPGSEKESFYYPSLPIERAKQLKAKIELDKALSASDSLKEDIRRRNADQVNTINARAEFEITQARNAATEKAGGMPSEMGWWNVRMGEVSLSGEDRMNSFMKPEKTAGQEMLDYRRGIDRELRQMTEEQLRDSRKLSAADLERMEVLDKYTAKEEKLVELLKDKQLTEEQRMAAEAQLAGLPGQAARSASRAGLLAENGSLAMEFGGGESTGTGFLQRQAENNMTAWKPLESLDSKASALLGTFTAVKDILQNVLVKLGDKPKAI